MFLKDKVDICITTGSRLMTDSQNSLVVVTKKGKRTLPLERVGSITVFKENDQIDYEVLNLCRKYEIFITFLTQTGKPVADIHYSFPKNVYLRVKQTEKHLDQEARLQIAKYFLESKLKNSLAMLKSSDYKTEYKIYDISDSETFERLLGLEGALAQQYFRAYAKLFRNTDLEFNGRSKHPPKDEVNALLSFLYTVLNYDIMHQLQTCGLDPYIGFLHHDYYGRPSLSCDFLEEFRSVWVDKFVLTMVNRKEMVKDDFEEKMIEGHNAGVYLKKDSLQKLFLKWSIWYKKQELASKRWGEKCTRRRLVEKQIRHFIGFLNGDEERYNGFDIANV